MTAYIEKIQSGIQESIEVKERMLQDSKMLCEISNIADCMISTIGNGGKILICGNGGSACDAQHIAGEIVGRFQRERSARAAVALASDIATITSVANDYGYEQIFSRQVEGLMSEKDILIGISTSGNSINVVRAFEKGREIGGKTILFSGGNGGKLKALSDFAVIIPSVVTAHIQEAHECVYHILCGLLEEAFS